MTDYDHDDPTLARFRQRMAGIEAYVPDAPMPPPMRASVSTRLVRRDSSGPHAALSLVALAAVVALAVLAVPLLAGLAPATTHPPGLAESPDHGGRFHVDRVIQPDSASLIQAADLIVLGRLGANGREYARSSDHKILHMAHDFTVDSKLAGSGAAVGETIPVLRSVYRDGEPVQGDGEAALMPGERYVLMLSKGDRIYWPVSGGQGAFLVEGERLRVLTDGVPTAKDFEGKSLDELAVMISEFVAASTTPPACPAAQIFGQLVADKDSGIALVDDADGRLVDVLWPDGWTVREGDDRLALIDETGGIVAHEGDHVEIGGGFTGGGNETTWWACGGDVTILPAQPTPGPTATGAPSPSLAQPTPLTPGTAGWVGPTRVATERYDFARLVVDRQGFAHVAAVTTNGILYLTNATGAWTTEQVTTPIGDGYDGEPSIVLADDGGVTIAFARFSALRCTLSCEPVRSRGIFVVTNATGSWSDAVAVIEGRAQEPSLQAAAGQVHLAYSHGEDRDRSVFYASLQGAEWVVEEVGKGETPSLRIGRDGIARIAYLDGRGRLNLAEAETPAGPFVTARVPGERVARTPLLALDADDEPHIAFFNDIEQSDPECGARHIERAGGRWRNAAAIFADDEFCHMIPESIDTDATGAVHVVSLYDSSLTGVWYANNAAGEFRAWQIREPKMFTDDGPPGVSALDLDNRGRPHIVFGVSEAGAYDEDTEGRPEDDGLWYGIGSAN